jgi:hypothetical protein
MDAIGFLCVSLGSSTVQLHESLGSRRACTYSEAGFSGQNGDRAWGCTTEKQRSVLRLLWAKWHNTKNIHEEIFLLTVGSVCRVKRFTTGRQAFRWLRRGWNGGSKVPEIIVRRLLCCGFRRSGKAIGQVYQCWWRICREINVSSRFEYHMFYVLQPFVSYLLILPRMYDYVMYVCVRVCVCVDTLPFTLCDVTCSVLKYVSSCTESEACWK